MEKTAHKADAGDVIVIAGHRVGEAERTAEISRCWGTSPTSASASAGRTGTRACSGKRRDDQAGGPPARVEQVEALTAQASEVRSPP